MSKNQANYSESRREDWETPDWLFERCVDELLGARVGPVTLIETNR